MRPLTDARVCALGWFIAGALSWPYVIVVHDWVEAWRARHRDPCPPQDEALG